MKWIDIKDWKPLRENYASYLGYKNGKVIFFTIVENRCDWNINYLSEVDYGSEQTECFSKIETVIDYWASLDFCDGKCDEREKTSDISHNCWHRSGPLCNPSCYKRCQGCNNDWIGK